MSSLNLAQNNALQDQKKREILCSQYNVKAPAQDPLTAPTPTRAPVSPPSASPGMWSPEMGIKFAGVVLPPPIAANQHNPAYPNTRNAEARGGQWNPSQGVKFG